MKRTGVRILEVLAKWSPPESWTIHQWVTRIDGNGGFAVIETDDAASIALALTKFTPYLDFQVFPVLDFEAGVAVLTAGHAVHRLDRLTAVPRAYLFQSELRSAINCKKAPRLPRGLYTPSPAVWIGLPLVLRPGR